MSDELIPYRIYGDGKIKVVVLHGGPGAAGYLSPLAKQIVEYTSVAEPLQRRSSDDNPLSVAQHVIDLDNIINALCENEKPVIIGHSWGAMLALAYAAKFPEKIAALLLIGCGTWNEKSRQILKDARSKRMANQLTMNMQQIAMNIADPDQRFCALGRLISLDDSYDLIDLANYLESGDAKGYAETWNNMLRLQQNGTYPDAFSVVKCPILMIHGNYDPHPGKIIAENLRNFMPQIQYVEIDRCGHYPWLEKYAQNEFYQTLKSHIEKHLHSNC
jgi:pimeloyl-ACP methyl ester carboxylesterase